MTRQDVIERLCALTTKVGREQFNHVEPTDCWCGEMHSSSWDYFQFSEVVMQFIEKSVNDALKKEKL